MPLRIMYINWRGGVVERNFSRIQNLFNRVFKKNAKVKTLKTLISPTWWCQACIVLCIKNMNLVRQGTLSVLFYWISMKSYAGMMDIKFKWPILGKTVSAFCIQAGLPCCTFYTECGIFHTMTSYSKILVINILIFQIFLCSAMSRGADLTTNTVNFDL